MQEGANSPLSSRVFRVKNDKVFVGLKPAPGLGAEGFGEPSDADLFIRRDLLPSPQKIKQDQYLEPEGLEYQWDVFVSSPEERQSEQPNRSSILSSTCETELEEVNYHKRNQHRSKRQRLIPSPLQTSERVLDNARMSRVQLVR